MRRRAAARGVRVAVVGAGVLGASAAWGLHEAGAEVVLVEAEGPGTGTSSRGAGLVCEGMWHPTNLALVRRSMTLLAELSERCAAGGGAFRYHPTGSSTLVPEAQVPAVRALVARQREWGAQARFLSPDEARGLPRHAGVRLDDAAEVVHYPRDGWASPRLYAETLHAHLDAERCPHLRGAARLRGGALLVDGEPVRADAVVLAAGVRTREMLRSGGLDAPLEAYRTQAVRYHHPDAAGVPILHDAVQGFYLRPGEPGQLLAGNGTTTTPEDPDAWRREADPWFTEATLRRLRHRFPALVHGGVLGEGWAGLDAATPDRLLLAGPHPDAPRVWLLAGGNGYGFMRAPAAGEALAHLLVGRAPPVPLDAYDPGRFAGRMSTPFAVREGFSLEPHA